MKLCYYLLCCNLALNYVVRNCTFRTIERVDISLESLDWVHYVVDALPLKLPENIIWLTAGNETHGWPEKIAKKLACGPL